MLQMASLIELLKRRNYNIRDNAATSVASGACECWAFPLTTNYKEFICLAEGTRESSKFENLRKIKGKEVESKNPAASNTKRTRKEKDVESKNSAAIKGKGKVESIKTAAIRAPKVKGTTSRTRKVVEPANPAGNGYNNNSNNLTSDVEGYSDDITLGEFLRKHRTTKKRKVALDVEPELPRLSVPSSSGGLKAPGSVSRAHKSVVEDGVSNKKHKTLDIEDLRRSLATVWPTGGLGVLELPGSKNKPVVVEIEDRRLVASEPWPIGSSGGLQPHASAFRAYKPIAGVDTSTLFVARPGPLDSSGGQGGVRLLCLVNQNPDELSTVNASSFMRSYQV